MAGNVTIGSGAILECGKVAVADKWSIGDHAMVGPLSGVAKDVKPGEQVMGGLRAIPLVTGGRSCCSWSGCRNFSVTHQRLGSHERAATTNALRKPKIFQRAEINSACGDAGIELTTPHQSREKSASVSMAEIHSTAIVHPDAQIHESCSIGPFCTVDKDVALGPGNRLLSHVVIQNHVTAGSENVFHPFAVVGGILDLKYQGEKSEIIIGNNNTIRNR